MWNDCETGGREKLDEAQHGGKRDEEKVMEKKEERRASEMDSKHCDEMELLRIGHVRLRSPLKSAHLSIRTIRLLRERAVCVAFFLCIAQSQLGFCPRAERVFRASRFYRR